MNVVSQHLYQCTLLHISRDNVMVHHHELFTSKEDKSHEETGEDRPRVL